MDAFGGARVMTTAPVILEQSPDGLVTVTMNRPDMHNALDESSVQEITRTFDMLGSDPFCRVVMLKANGQSFCAGSDMDSMQRTLDAVQHSHLAEGHNLAQMMRILYDFPKPIIAMVHGVAMGIGVGILACADIVVASDAASFRFSESKIGLVPAIIAPYVVQVMGVRAARRYFLTAEPFSATEAKMLGLVHEIVPDRMMAAAAAKMVERLLACGPKAQNATKDLLRRLEAHHSSEELDEFAINLYARLRSSPEGREGLLSYIEKRKPNWPRR